MTTRHGYTEPVGDLYGRHLKWWREREYETFAAREMVVTNLRTGEKRTLINTVEGWVMPDKEKDNGSAPNSN